jgi:hypothetical protein
MVTYDKKLYKRNFSFISVLNVEVSPQRPKDKRTVVGHAEYLALGATEQQLALLIASKTTQHHTANTLCFAPDSS